MEKIILEWAYNNIATIPLQAWAALAVVVLLAIPFIVKVIKSWRELLFGKPEPLRLAMGVAPSRNIEKEIQPHWLITVLDMIGVQIQNVSNDTTTIRDNSIWMHADNENFQRTVHDELRAMKDVITALSRKVGEMVDQVSTQNRLLRSRQKRK